MAAPLKILISRTDAIGDVVLTLPLATILKRQLPGSYIGFLGKAYTKPVIECCSAVDEFIEVSNFLTSSPAAIKNKNWEAILHVFPRKNIAWQALRARIPMRIGTSSRAYHWLTCTKLIKLSRRNSILHEAQLNTKLLEALSIYRSYTKTELGQLYSFNKIQPLPEQLKSIFQPGKRHIILHPKSQGSAREWGLDHFATLIRLLPRERYQIFISGTQSERQLLQPLFNQIGSEVSDITGMMDLATFIAFIAASDALVAASTGPLHIAAALGKTAIGLYPPIRPMHAGRWGPLGNNAIAISLFGECNECSKSPDNCSCIRSITAIEVAHNIIRMLP